MINIVRKTFLTFALSILGVFLLIGCASTNSADNVTKEEILTKQKEMEEQLEKLETLLTEVKELKTENVFERKEGAAFAEFKAEEALKQLEELENKMIDSDLEIKVSRNESGIFIHSMDTTDTSKFDSEMNSIDREGEFVFEMDTHYTTGIQLTKNNERKGYVSFEWGDIEGEEVNLKKEVFARLVKLKTEDKKSFFINYDGDHIPLIKELRSFSTSSFINKANSESPQFYKLTLPIEMDRVFREIQPSSYDTNVSLIIEKTDGGSLQVPLEHKNLENLCFLYNLYKFTEFL